MPKNLSNIAQIGEYTDPGANAVLNILAQIQGGAGAGFTQGQSTGLQILKMLADQKQPEDTSFKERSLAVREGNLRLRKIAGQDKELSQAIQTYNVNMKLYNTTGSENYLKMAQNAGTTVMEKYNRTYPKNPITEEELIEITTEEPKTFLGIPFGKKQVTKTEVVPKGTKGIIKQTEDPLGLFK